MRLAECPEQVAPGPIGLGKAVRKVAPECPQLEQPKRVGKDHRRCFVARQSDLDLDRERLVRYTLGCCILGQARSAAGWQATASSLLRGECCQFS